MSKIVSRKFHHMTGTVHDLTVENSHSYNVEGKGVHNSAPGSLINYILGITQIDPLPFDLLWNRFLGRHRCMQSETLVITEHGVKTIKDLELGDKVLTSSGVHEQVVDKEDDTNHTFKAIIKTARQDFVCSPNHRWLVKRDGEIIEVLTAEIVKGDKLLFLTGMPNA